MKSWLTVAQQWWRFTSLALDSSACWMQSWQYLSSDRRMINNLSCESHSKCTLSLKRTRFQFVLSEYLFNMTVTHSTRRRAVFSLTHFFLQTTHLWYFIMLIACCMIRSEHSSSTSKSSCSQVKIRASSSFSSRIRFISRIFCELTIEWRSRFSIVVNSLWCLRDWLLRALHSAAWLTLNVRKTSSWSRECSFYRKILRQLWFLI